MREYGQIQCSFWTSNDIQSLSDQSKLLALYLLSGPHSNGLGCYRLPDGYIQDDLGWSKEMVSKGFKELFLNGMANRCERTFYVIIYDFLRWNQIQNTNVAKARVKEFDSIPVKSIVYKDLASSLLKYGNHLDEPFRNRLETISKQDPTLPDPEPDPKPEPDPNPTQSPEESKKPYPAEFEDIWLIYPKRVGDRNKKGSHASWNARRKEGVGIIDLMAAVKRYSDFCDATDKTDTEFVMQGSRFFGKGDEAPWTQDWKVPDDKPGQQQSIHDHNQAAVAEFLSQDDERQENKDSAIEGECEDVTE